MPALGVAESRTDSGPKKFAWGMALTMISSVMSMKIMAFTLTETMINFL